MKPTNIIGITGGIASGKSTVSNYLKKEGYFVIDADRIAREVMDIGEEGYFKTIEYFGQDILLDNGNIDRFKLGNIVFNNREKLELLNNITHPIIFRTIKNKIDSTSERIIFLDIPLLYETYEEIKSYGIDFGDIWLVYVDEKTQINRLMNRNDLGVEEAKNRIDSQISMDKKLNYENIVIDNRKGLESLILQIDNLLEKIE